MLKFPKSMPMRVVLASAAVLIAGFAIVKVQAEPANPSKGLGLGRLATEKEILAWDIDVRPDGHGLPKGKGSVPKGEAIFAAKCAICHGDFGEGIDRWPVLAGGLDTLKSDNPVKTVGSYWPYLSTAYDYIYRAMPYGNAQTLKPDEMYSIIAYLLFMNDIIEDDQFVLSDENFTTVRLPNEKNFIDDPRPDTPTLKQNEPCMQDCKPEVKVTKRARILDVTPRTDDEDAGRGAID